MKQMFIIRWSTCLNTHVRRRERQGLTSSNSTVHLFTKAFDYGDKFKETGDSVSTWCIHYMEGLPTAVGCRR